MAKTINDVGFDDLEGALEAAAGLFERGELTTDFFHTLTRGFTDPDEFLARARERGLQPNADQDVSLRGRT